jgi:2,3-bisphosphoglycerate-dependent phosphoglycerate mutase
VVARVLPYWHNEVVPQLQADMNVLVTAHGNSLRALVMYLEGISEADIAELNIPTGVPRRFTFDSSMKVTDVAYLGDQAAIEAAAAAVANQSK